MLVLSAGALCAEAVAGSIELPAVRGQIIRIELPGDDRVLSLAEVRVFEKGAISFLVRRPISVDMTATTG